MANRTCRKMGTLGKLVVALAVFLVVVIVIVFFWYILAGRLPKEVPTPVPTTPQQPLSQPADCPDVQMVAVPGTWESSASDDPYNPTSNPASLMLNVTHPLQQQFAPARADIYTVPYVAQFSNPIAIPPDGQASYNNSRSSGTAAAKAELTKVATRCPLTNFVIAGFSQGAVIAGDIASDIGNGKGPISADRVLGVTLIADGRRDGMSGQSIGPAPDGVGAEVALGGLDVPGITLTGVRQGGFGTLNSKTNNICAPGDLICAAPSDGMSLRNIPESLTILIGASRNPVHGKYNSFVVDDAGTTATQWTAKWAAGLIDAAPVPPHS